MRVFCTHRRVSGRLVLAKHGSIHSGNNSKILAVRCLRFDYDVVSLRNSHEQLLHNIGLNIDAVNFDDSHGMAIKLNILAGDCSHIDDTEQACLAWDHGKLDVLSPVDKIAVGNRLRTTVVVSVRDRLVVVDQVRCLLMVVICQGDRDILIDGPIRRSGILDNERAAETIDVLTTMVAVVPVCADLHRSKLVNERRSRGNRALRDKGWPIFERGVPLEDAVEVNRRALVSKVVVDVENQNVAVIQHNGGRRPLSVHPNHGTH